MVLDLLIVGLAITLGPMPQDTAFILLLSTHRGFARGWPSSWPGSPPLVLVIAIVVLFTGGTPTRPHSSPSVAGEAVKLAVGLGLIIFGEAKRRRRAEQPHAPANRLAALHNVSTWTAAGFGVLLQPWWLVAVGAATVLGAKLSGIASYVALLGFCLLATGSILAMELYSAFAPEKAERRLDQLRSWLDRHTDQVVVTLSLLVGLWLVSKSIYQLVT